MTQRNAGELCFDTETSIACSKLLISVIIIIYFFLNDLLGEFLLTGIGAGELNSEHISSTLRRKESLVRLTFWGISKDQSQQLRACDMVELCRLLIQLPRLQTLVLSRKISRIFVISQRLLFELCFCWRSVFELRLQIIIIVI